MGNPAIRGHGQEALGQVVIEGKHRPEAADGLDLARALARHVVHLPERQRRVPAALGCALKGCHRHLQPAAPLPVEDARPHVDLLLADLAAIGGAIEPVEGLGRLRLSREQLLQRGLAPGACAGEAPQGLVAVQHRAGAADNLKAGVEAVRDGLDDVGFGRALAQAQKTREQPEHQEDARSGQQGQQTEPDCLDQAARLVRSGAGTADSE